MRCGWIAVGALRWVAPVLIGAALLLAGDSPAALLPKDALERVPTALPGAEALPKELREELARNLHARGSEYEPRTQNLREDGSPLFTNRLFLERSPYLLQHAHNPVNWYPWGDEAFEAAKRLGRPVLVSIGYSTCHWCHVMEEESFDVKEIALQLNRDFIAIKIDREARPDIDAVYMSALHAMGQRGGWPLNAFVTPDRKPFYGGTYFPPSDMRGRPSFSRVLRTIKEQFDKDPEAVGATAERVAVELRKNLESRVATSSRAPTDAILKWARHDAGNRMDLEWGGQQGSPKFPSSMPLRFLLRYARRSGDEQALWMATHTLGKMAAGGMYDQIGGGFHRYSTDAHWLVPHFEKMLYDNALLVSTFVEAWQTTGDDEHQRIAREILQYLDREMTSEEGVFYSATDADNLAPNGEMEEGAFFTWTPKETLDALGAKQATIVNAYYDISDAGNFEGRTIPSVSRSARDVANELGLSRTAVEKAVREGKERLYEVRLRRNAPLRDEKVLVAWNGLAISAYAKAGFAFGEERYVESAGRAASFILENMRDGARLRRVYKSGKAWGPAFLEDYAFFIQGLLDLHEASQDLRWLREALALQKVLDTHYLDELGGGYFKTANDGEKLLAREKPGSDAAIPAGNSVEALNLLRLAEFTGDTEHLSTFDLLYSAFDEVLTSSPSALSEMLLAVDYALDTTKEIVLVRPEVGGDLDAMLAPIRAAFVPNSILAVTTEGAEMKKRGELIPLVKHRVARQGQVTAYVCQKQICLLPTADPKVLAEQIGGVDVVIE